MPYDY
jgi:hypothetical protein